MARLTRWFPPEVKPVRDGVYIATVDRAEVYYRHWDGRHWYIGGPRLADADSGYASGIPLSKHSDIHWRGLAKEPEQK